MEQQQFNPQRVSQLTTILLKAIQNSSSLRQDCVFEIGGGALMITAGTSCLIWNHRKLAWMTVAMASVGHHAGLPDQYAVTNAI